MSSKKNAKPGGLLRYGIPDFKMEKHIIDRRVNQMEREGVIFHCGQDVRNPHEVLSAYDAIVLAGGCEHPRDLPVEGREMDGVHFAMDFLTQQNRRVGGESVLTKEIFAGGKHVIVIGGGDTGSDCIGTSFRQGALSVTQLEIMPQPPLAENTALTWPDWPLKLRTSSSQEEGADRDWAVMTEGLSGEDGQITRLHGVRVDEKMQESRALRVCIARRSRFARDGVCSSGARGLLEKLDVKLSERGNVAADDRDYKTSLDKVFVAGDMRRGQSLVVWAIREGRQAARAVDEYLLGSTQLPR